MCKQSYLKFETCGCELRHRFLECDHGRDSPLCIHVKTVLLRSSHIRCHYHKKVEERRESAWEFYWQARGRKLWPAPPLQPGQRIPALEDPIPNEEMEVDPSYSDLYP